MADDKRRIYLGSLSFQTDDESLRELCEKHGPIEDVKVITDRDTGRSRGFGFVTFENEEDAVNCVEAVNGMEWDGRIVKVSIATGRSNRGGSRGGFRGGQRGGSRGGGFRGGRYNDGGYGQGGYGGRSGGGFGGDRQGYRDGDGSYGGGGSDGYGRGRYNDRY